MYMFKTKALRSTGLLCLRANVAVLSSTTLCSTRRKHNQSWVSLLKHFLNFVITACQLYRVSFPVVFPPLLDVTVNSLKRGVTLEPLQPDTRYSVHVMASAVTGATNSSVIHFTTSRYGKVMSVGFTHHLIVTHGNTDWHFKSLFMVLHIHSMYPLWSTGL